MSRVEKVLPAPRLREIEALARQLLSRLKRITPYTLGDRAKINWFLARDILRGLVNKGDAAALEDGYFGRPSRR